jgi:hypothetical protein
MRRKKERSELLKKNHLPHVKFSFLTRFFNTNFAIFASKVAVGRKYCKNEGLCKSLIINNKNFFDKLWGCNWCPIGVQLSLN